MPSNNLPKTLRVSYLSNDGTRSAVLGVSRHGSLCIPTNDGELILRDMDVAAFFGLGDVAAAQEEIAALRLCVDLLEAKLVGSK